MKLTFGKHKGTELSEVPDEYLNWGADKLRNPQWSKAFAEEIQRRNDEEADFNKRLAANPDDPESMQELLVRYVHEINREIRDSGCEWEYDNYNVDAEAAERLKERVMVVQTEQKLEALKQEYASKLDGEKTLDRILSHHLNDNLTRDKFTTEAHYSLAIEYCQKYDAIATMEYYQASLRGHI